MPTLPTPHMLENSFGARCRSLALIALASALLGIPAFADEITVITGSIHTQDSNYGIQMTPGGTVTNHGSIIGVNNTGVDIQNGPGIITNDLTGLIEGLNAGVNLHAGGTIANSGTINATSGKGIISDGAQTLITNSGGLIRGTNDGIQLTTGGTLRNLGGLVEGTGAGISAVYVAVGSAVFENTGTLRGDGNGIFATGRIDVTNSGLIQGQTEVGIYAQAADSTITNNTGGLITGGTYGVRLTAGGAVTNSGSIVGTSDYGIYASSQPVHITNTTGGVISGGDDGIDLSGGGTVTNSGSIVGADYYGIYASNQPVHITNTTGGVISGGYDGIRLLAGGTVTNSGSIVGTDHYGIHANNQPVHITNTTGGVISGGQHGIVLNTGGTIANAGIITGGSMALNLTGAVTVTNSGTLTGKVGALGAAAGDLQSLTITGNGLWDNSESLTIGLTGAGELTIADSGTVKVGGATILAQNSTATATLNLRGGVLETTGIIKGDPAGSATLNLNGGAIRATANNADFFQNFGDLVINGTGVAPDAAALTFDVALGAEVTATNNFTFAYNAGNTRLAFDKTGAGYLFLTGTSDLTAEGTTVGDMRVSESRLAVNGGLIVNTLTIDNTANTDITSFGVGIGGGVGEGRVTTHGNLIAGWQGVGNLIIRKGSVTTHGEGIIGGDSTGAGIVSVDTTGFWNVSGHDIFVGKSGTGALTITDSGTVKNAAGYIGYNANSSGSVSVSGTGVWVNTGSLVIGKNGHGVLDISDTGVVNVTGLTIIGEISQNTGEVYLDDSGTLASGDIVVGGTGHGTLTIVGAADATTTGYVTVGRDSTGRGEIFVSDTGALNVGTDLTIGQSGTGVLSLRDSASVTAGGAASLGAAGTLLTGSGSSTLTAATLAITDGAKTIFDLDGVTAGAPALLNLTAATITGSSALNIRNATELTAGVYDLIAYGAGSAQAAFAAATFNDELTTRTSRDAHALRLRYDAPSSTLKLTALDASVALDLIWTGAESNIWKNDGGTPGELLNWRDTAGNTFAFKNADAVTFGAPGYLQTGTADIDAAGVTIAALGANPGMTIAGGTWAIRGGAITGGAIAYAGASDVTFGGENADGSGTRTLTQTGTLAANASLTLAAAASSTLTITKDAADTTTSALSVGANATLTLNSTPDAQIAFVGNRATNGGAIYNIATLTGTNLLFTSNTAVNFGGALYNDTGATATLVNSTFTTNVSATGGAIYNRATLSGTNLVFTSNTASNWGGALYNNPGATATLDSSTFTGNRANYGGAILNEATLSGTNLVFTSNTATFSGGAIFNSGTLTGTNLLIASNTATNNGGGIYTMTSTLTLASSTLQGNYAGQSGGAIYASSSLAIGGGDIVLNSNTAASTVSAMGGGGIYAKGNIHINGALSGSGNYAGQDGGAIRSETGSITIAGPAILISNTAQNGVGGALAAIAGAVNISSGTLANNYAGQWGGAIYSSGTSTITNATFTSNYSGNTGGAFYSAGGNVTLANDLFASNTAGFEGGAIAIHGSTGTAIITSATIRDNYAASSAGAIYNNDATLLATGVLISSNTSNAHGGALFNNGGKVTIVSATIQANRTNGGGGGAIHNGVSGVLSATNVAFTGNSAGGSGGAVYQDAGLVTLTDATFTSNTAANQGGAIYNATARTLALNITAGTAIDATGNTATSGTGGFLHNDGLATIDVGTGGSFTIGASAAADAAIDSISGSGALTKTGDGLLTLHADNSDYTGLFTISAGTVALTRANNLSAAPVHLGAATATLDTTAAQTFTRLTGTGVLNAHDQAITSRGGDASRITFTDVGAFTVNTGSAVTLGNGQTVASLAVQAGVLAISASNTSLNVTGNAAFAASTTLNLAHDSNAATPALDIGGALAIDAVGTTLNLASYNIAPVTMPIQSGTYPFAAPPPVTLVNAIGGITGDFANITIGGNAINATGTVTLDEFAGATIQKIANGASLGDRLDAHIGLYWYNTADDSAHGTFRITAGNLFEIKSALVDNTVTAAHAFGWDGKTLTKTEAGTLVLSATNTYTGTTNILGGTLVAKNVHATGTGNVTNAATFQLDLDAANSGTYANNILGTGTTQKTGAGDLTTTGSITQTVQVDAGNYANRGTIDASNIAVFMNAAGGTLANNGLIRSGATGVEVTAASTVLNTGTIIGVAGLGLKATNAAVLLTNTGGLIRGSSDGIELAAGGTLRNTAGGLIEGTGAGNSGVFGKVSVDIVNSATITGGGWGVFIDGSGTILNAGVIAGTNHAGVLGMTGPLTLTNTTGALITGGAYGVRVQAGGTIANAGIIRGLNVNTGIGISATTAVAIANTGLVEGGNYGLSVAGGTVYNSGTLHGVTSSGFQATQLITATNAPTGLIMGGDNGMQFDNGGSLVNLGVVTGTKATTSQGIYTNSKSIYVDNRSGARISGSTMGIQLNAGGTVTNAGAITGGADAGIYSAQAAVITNTTGGLITGGTNAIRLGLGGEIANTGTLTSSIAQAIYAEGAETHVTNAGLIKGATSGVALAAGGTVGNTGTITGATIGVLLNAGGTITNHGLISSQTHGAIETYNVAATIDNKAGGIIAGNNNGIYMEAGGHVTNAGAITGTNYHGVSLLAVGTVTNTGTIRGITRDGIYAEGDLLVTNTAGALIEGVNSGIRINTPTATATIANSGTIRATGPGSGGINSLSLADITNSGLIDGATDGVWLGNGGTVMNLGIIRGVANDGVHIAGGSGLVVNAGTIETTGDDAVQFSAGGTLQNTGTLRGAYGVYNTTSPILVENAASALITARTNAILMGAGGTVTNAGRITADNNDAIFAGARATVTNTTGGVISGPTYAISLAADAANQVHLWNGSVLAGHANIAGASSLLTLNGDAVQSYAAAVTGNTTFSGTLVKLDAGTWTLDSTAAQLAGLRQAATRVESGTLIVNWTTHQLNSARAYIAAANASTLQVQKTTAASATFNSPLTGGGYLDLVNTSNDAGGQFALSSAVGPNFTGTIGIRGTAHTATFLLDDNADAALTAATLRLGDKSATTLTTDRTIHGLDLAGGTLHVKALDNDTDGVRPYLLTVDTLAVSAASGTAASKIGVDTAILSGIVQPIASNAGLNDNIFDVDVLPPDYLLNKRTLVDSTANGPANGIAFDLVDSDNAALPTGTSTLTYGQNGVAPVGKNTYGYNAITQDGDLVLNYGLVSIESLHATERILIDPTGSLDKTLSAKLTGAGAGFTFTGNETITLGHTANDYTGATLITGHATLLAGAANVIQTSSTVTIDADAAFDLGGHDQRLQDLSGAGRIHLGAQTLTVDNTAYTGTLSGIIDGTGNLTLAAGSFALTGSNTYTGATQIALGATLTLGSGGTTGSIDGTSPITNAGTLQLHRSDATVITNTIANTGLVNIKAGSGNVTLTGAIAGTGTLVQNAAALATLTGANNTDILVNAGTVQLGNGTVTGWHTGTIARKLTVADATAELIFNHGDELTIDTVITGPGKVAVTGTGTTIIKKAQTYTGATRIENGMVRLDIANALQPSSGLTLTDAMLDLNNNAQTIKNLRGTPGYPGYLAYGTPAGAATKYTTLTITGSLTGETVHFMNVDLVNRQTDKLIVQGSATGEHWVEFESTNATPLNDPTRKYALEAIKVAPGSTAEFASNGLESGFHTYELHQGDGGLIMPDKNAWYLSGGDSRSRAADAVLFTAGMQGVDWHYELDNVYKRMGDIRADNMLATRHSPPAATSALTGSVWTRANAYRLNASADLGGSEFQQDTYGITAGADKLFRRENALLALGGYIGMGRSNRTFDDVNNQYGDGDTSAVGVGAYALWLYDNAWFVDATLKFDRYNNEINARGVDGHVSRGKYTNKAQGLSIETGRRLTKGRYWVEPSAQVAVAWINGADYTVSNGVNADLQIHIGDSDAWQYRASLRGGADLGKWRPYAKLGAVKTDTNGGEVTTDGRSYQPWFDGYRLEAGAGVSYLIDEQSQVYFDYEYNRASYYERPWALNLGYRRAW